MFDKTCAMNRVRTHFGLHPTKKAATAEAQKIQALDEHNTDAFENNQYVWDNHFDIDFSAPLPPGNANRPNYVPQWCALHIHIVCSICRTTMLLFKLKQFVAQHCNRVPPDQ